MAFQSVAHLFQEDRRALGKEDVGHVVENFLRNKVKSDAVYCKVYDRGGDVRIRVRVGSAALAEAVLIREQDVREFVAESLDISLGGIRVMV